MNIQRADTHDERSCRLDPHHLSPTLEFPGGEAASREATTEARVGLRARSEG